LSARDDIRQRRIRNSSHARSKSSLSVESERVPVREGRVPASDDSQPDTVHAQIQRHVVGGRPCQKPSTSVVEFESVSGDSNAVEKRRRTERTGRHSLPGCCRFVVLWWRAAVVADEQNRVQTESRCVVDAKLDALWYMSWKLRSSRTWRRRSTCPHLCWVSLSSSTSCFCVSLSCRFGITAKIAASLWTRYRP